MQYDSQHELTINCCAFCRALPEGPHPHRPCVAETKCCFVVLKACGAEAWLYQDQRLGGSHILKQLPQAGHEVFWNAVQKPVKTGTSLNGVLSASNNGRPSKSDVFAPGAIFTCIMCGWFQALDPYSLAPSACDAVQSWAWGNNAHVVVFAITAQCVNQASLHTATGSPRPAFLHTCQVMHAGMCSGCPAVIVHREKSASRSI